MLPILGTGYSVLRTPLLGRGLLTTPLARPQVSKHKGDLRSGEGARSGDRAPTGWVLLPSPPPSSPPGRREQYNPLTPSASATRRRGAAPRPWGLPSPRTPGR